jgi:hypothetical protein
MVLIPSEQLHRAGSTPRTMFRRAKVSLRGSFTSGSRGGVHKSGIHLLAGPDTISAVLSGLATEHRNTDCPRGTGRRPSILQKTVTGSRSSSHAVHTPGFLDSQAMQWWRSTKGMRASTAGRHASAEGLGDCSVLWRLLTYGAFGAG